MSQCSLKHLPDGPGKDMKFLFVFSHKQKKLKPHKKYFCSENGWCVWSVFTSGMSYFWLFVPEMWLKKPVCLLKKANRLFKIFWIHKYAKISWCSVATAKFSHFTIFHSVYVLDYDEYDLKTVGILTNFFLRSTTCTHTCQLLLLQKHLM